MGTIKTLADAAFRDYETKGVRASGAYDPKKSDIRDVFKKVDDKVTTLETVVTSGRKAYATYSALAATSATAGTVAEVPPSDSGNHTDPVVGGTVANSGIYSYSTSPAGWQRIYDYGVLNVADKSEALKSLIDGGGDTDKALTPATLSPVLNEFAIFTAALQKVRPTKSKPYVAVKVSAYRWWVATFVKDGHRMDLAVHEMQNIGPFQTPAISDCWRYNGGVAWIDGLFEPFANFFAINGGSGYDSFEPPIYEPVFYAGATTGGDKDFIGPGHGHLKSPTSAIYLNGSTGTNYRLAANSPVGTILRGTSLVWDQTFTAYLKDDTTVVGTYAFGHTWVEGGVQIAGSLAVSGTNIGIQTFYGALLSSFADRVKPAGITAVEADQEDGNEYGAGGVKDANLGEAASFQTYNAARPTHIFEAVLNAAAPINDGSGYDWDGNLTNRDSWVQARSEGYAKTYVAGINRNDLLTADGMTFAFTVTYRFRKGALA